MKEKVRKSRIFYGCDQFPECDFLSWDKPLPRGCPKCESLLVEKKLKKGVQVQCVECDYKEEPQSLRVGRMLTLFSAKSKYTDRTLLTLFFTAIV